MRIFDNDDKWQLDCVSIEQRRIFRWTWNLIVKISKLEDKISRDYVLSFGGGCSCEHMSGRNFQILFVSPKSKSFILEEGETAQYYPHS